MDVNNRQLCWCQCLDRSCFERVLCLDLRNDAERDRKLRSVGDVYEERSHVPTLPGGFPGHETSFPSQYISRFQGSLPLLSTLILFQVCPTGAGLYEGLPFSPKSAADRYVG